MCKLSLSYFEQICNTAHPFPESKGERGHFIYVNDQMSLSIGTPHISVMLSSTTALDAYSISLSLLVLFSSLLAKEAIIILPTPPP